MSYVQSFGYVGFYWNNHHHLLKAVDRIRGGVLWANLLFWHSLLPFAAGYLGENHFAAAPTALYGIVLLMAGVAYTIQVRTLLAHHEKDSALARAIGRDCTGLLSLVLYASGLGLSFVVPWVTNALSVLVAVIWLVPDSVSRATSTRSPNASCSSAASPRGPYAWGSRKRTT